MKKIVFCKYEYAIMTLFALGLIPQFCYLHLSFPAFVVFYYFGMTFEFTTEAAWNYNPLLLNSTFTVRDRDVNWIFGLGWQATLIFGLSLGQLLQQTLLTHWHPIWTASIGLGIVGNILEWVFLKLGLWKYNEQYWITTLWTGKPVMVGPIPIAVRIGYFGMGVIVYFIVHTIVPKVF